MKLVRYNEIVMAIVGTLILLGLAAIPVFTLFTAFDRATPAGLAVGPSSGPKPKQNLVFCPALTEAGGAFQYIPVGLVVAEDADTDPLLNPGQSYNKGSFYEGCGLESYNSSRIFNVVVRDLKTGRQKLLLDNPGQIGSLDLPDAKCAQGEGVAPCGTLLWEIRMADSNGDGRINRRDTLTAYVSDLEVSKLRALTPPDVTLLQATWIARAGMWQFRMRSDVNGDGRYTDEDGSLLLETDGANPAAATSVVDPAVLETLKASAR